MLVSGKTILAKANREGYAVPHFNINNMEILQAVISGCKEMNSPVFVATSEGGIEYAGMDYLTSMVHLAAKKEKIPIAFHVDHGKDLKLIKKAINSGYTSVMYDGSSLPYNKNVSNTKLVKQWAGKKIMVEAEIGVLAGVEDKVKVSKQSARFTNPEEAVRFAKESNCDALAIAIGTSHGAFKYSGTTKLNYKILSEVKERTKMPLVLHGASGIDKQMVLMASKYGAILKGAQGVNDSAIKKAVSLGINKINIDSDLRIAFDAGIRKALKEKPEVFDPRKILQPASEEMKKIVMKKCSLFGSQGKA